MAHPWPRPATLRHSPVCRVTSGGNGHVLGASLTYVSACWPHTPWMSQRSWLCRASGFLCDSVWTGAARTRDGYIDRGSARGGCPFSAVGSGVWVEVDADVAGRHLESFRVAARCQEWQESSPQFLRLVTARLICGTACHPRWFARLSLFPGACTARVG